MNEYGITDALLAEHRSRVKQTRRSIRMVMSVLDEDETSMMLGYPQYYLQVSFSLCHPLMVVSLARMLENSGSSQQLEKVNELNLHSVLGCHAVNRELGCYTYRVTQWLDTGLDSARFLEILGRCSEEADKGFFQILRLGVADCQTDSCN